MKRKKIPGKKGMFPTHYIWCCVKCNTELLRTDWGGIKGWKCNGCGMLYADNDPRRIPAVEFQTYGPDKTS